MAVIGNFRELETGGFAGEILTLTLILKGVLIRPSPGEESAYVISAGPVEFGTAWADLPAGGRRRLRVQLDDLSFAGPVHAVLEEAADAWQLVWTR